MSTPDEIAARLRRVRTQIGAFRQLHSQELDLILDELRDIADTAIEKPASDVTPETSPKRAKWLAEQEERSRRSRRELLRGREKGASD